MLYFRKMKKFLGLLALIVIGFAANAQEIPKWKIGDVDKYIASKPGEVVIINFWATFCKPCVAEIPYFIELSNQYKDKKVSLMLISLDLPSQYPVKIRKFASKHGFNASISWLDETNADYFCPRIDSSWSGSIPATLILHTGTGYRKFFEEEMKKEKLEAEILAALESAKK